jgi:hypothetical protein
LEEEEKTISLPQFQIPHANTFGYILSHVVVKNQNKGFEKVTKNLGS